MYAQSRLVTSVRGIGLLPTTAARVSLGCTGFMNAAFGFRLLAAFFAMSSPCVRRSIRAPRPIWLPHSMNAFPSLYQREIAGWGLAQSPTVRCGCVLDPFGQRLPL